MTFVSKVQLALESTSWQLSTYTFVNTMINYSLFFLQRDIFNKHEKNHAKYYEKNIILEEIS